MVERLCRMGRRVTTNEIGYEERILVDCFSNSPAGVAVVDDDLSCIAINTSLAAMHGLPPDVHLRNGLRELFGEAGSELEAAIRQVFASGRTVVDVRIVGVLRNGIETGPWIGSLLPLTNEKGTVTRVAVIVGEFAPNKHPGQAQAKVFPYSPRTAMHSWRGIADYLGASVKTVQRWEQIHDFPVRRLRGAKGAMVFALRDEIDRWMRSRGRLAHATG
jgi:PAS domain-containing protein